jgi:hypothetical protein
MSATSTPSASGLDISGLDIPGRSKAARYRGDDNGQSGTEEQHVKARDESHEVLCTKTGAARSRQADCQESQADAHHDETGNPQGQRRLGHRSAHWVTARK